MNTNQHNSSVNPQGVDDGAQQVAIKHDGDGQTAIERLTRTIERASCLTDCLGVVLDAREKVAVK